MKKIYKYSIPPEKESELILPAGATILSAIEQNNCVVIYALINTDIEVHKKVSIYAAETGEEIPFDLSRRGFVFLGTVSLHRGTHIVHIYYLDHGYNGSEP